jgi:putative mRNA 3-end processing factor
MWVKKRSTEGKNLLFGSYSLGKSQEIISILNEMGIVPVVHPKVAHFSSIYNRHGHDLQYVESGTDEGNKMLSNRFVAIMPPNLINPEFLSSMQKVTNYKIAGALLTGWGMMYNFGSKGIEKVFPMSDHADFYQVIDYVKKSGAKKVFTVHGYSNELAAYLKKNLKVDARSLE